MIIFGTEPSPWTTSVFDMLEYSIRGVFNKWGNPVLVFGYETKHEAIAEGQAMVFRSNREFIQIAFRSKPQVSSLKYR